MAKVGTSAKNVAGAFRAFSYKSNVPFRSITTMQIGGTARHVVEVRTEKDIVEIMRIITARRLSYHVIGAGSNIIPPDNEYRGVIVKMALAKWDISKTTARVGAGCNLLAFIKRLNSHGLSGMERIAGIPGTVGGALHGNAGAYGQEIKDCVQSVRFFDGARIREYSRLNCRFGYRSSIFKSKKDWIIIGAEFLLQRAPKITLEKTSQEIIALRQKKYHQTLRCPGSFFKNIVLKNLPAEIQAVLKNTIPSDKITYGKIATGYLLEQVGACGIRRGGIQVAHHHGNLFYNTGTGRAADVRQLAQTLKTKVFKKFNIRLEEEVQYIS